MTMFGSAGSALEVAGSRPIGYLSNPTRISHFSEPLKGCGSAWGGSRGLCVRMKGWEEE